jgi:hypothetical protein
MLDDSVGAGEIDPFVAVCFLTHAIRRLTVFAFDFEDQRLPFGVAYLMTLNEEESPVRPRLVSAGRVPR